MRLSEAILLGSSIVQPNPGVLLGEWDGIVFGCALGMACKAENLTVSNPKKLDPVTEHWPWTLAQISQRDRDFCECIAPEMRINSAQFIAHVFDCHLATTYFPLEPAWTLEQLVDWVRSVEPAEPEAENFEIEARETGVIA